MAETDDVKPTVILREEKMLDDYIVNIKQEDSVPDSMLTVANMDEAEDVKPTVFHKGEIMLEDVSVEGKKEMPENEDDFTSDIKPEIPENEKDFISNVKQEMMPDREDSKSDAKPEKMEYPDYFIWDLKQGKLVDPNDFIIEVYHDVQADQDNVLDGGRILYNIKEEGDEKTLSADSSAPSDTAIEVGMDTTIELYGSCTQVIECNDQNDNNSATYGPNVGNVPKKIMPSVPCYSCNFCSLTFEKMVDLQKHQVVHKRRKVPYILHESRSGHCTELYIHKNFHNMKKKYYCDKCGYRSTRESTLINHKKTHPEPKIFYCNECPFSTLQECEMPLHEFLEHILEPFRCDKCDYRCQEQEGLEKHQLTHSRLQ